MKIVIEASELLVGMSATYRYSRELIPLVIRQEPQSIFMLFIYGRQQVMLPASLSDLPNLKLLEWKCPRRLASWCWSYLKFPIMEKWTGAADLCHYLGDPFMIPNKGIKQVFVLHGVTPLVAPDLLPSRYVKEFTKMLTVAAQNGAYFISVSNTAKLEFLAHFPWVNENRIAVIPLGVSNEFTPIPKDIAHKEVQKKFKIDGPYFFYIGQIGPIKNVKRLIQAYLLLKTQNQAVPRLVLAGYYPKGNHYQGIIKLLEEFKMEESAMQKSITFIGPISQETNLLPLLYNASEALVFPTLSEGWASPPLEAMACGTPVIVSNVSSLPETVGDAAILVDPYNVEAIAEGMDKIITDTKLREALINKGVARAKQFSWERCASATIDWYHEICKQTNLNDSKSCS